MHHETPQIDFSFRFFTLSSPGKCISILHALQYEFIFSLSQMQNVFDFPCKTSIITIHKFWILILIFKS